jgi:hypothetical protein
MRRSFIWFGLALLWAAIALAGLLHGHRGNAALEGAVAVLFLLAGATVQRRDQAIAARYTAKRPR